MHFTLWQNSVAVLAVGSYQESSHPVSNFISQRLSFQVQESELRCKIIVSQSEVLYLSKYHIQ